MAQSKGMSEYELARQERIKENQKMLEELFPEGTDIIKQSVGSRPVKRRRLTDANSLGTGSGSEASYSGDEGSSSALKAKRSYQIR